jgi:AhpD family alkylhydroperoxidase
MQRIAAKGGEPKMGTVANKKEVYAEIEQAFGKVPGWMQELPDTGLSSFWALMRDFYLAETEIPNKYKELIGLAVSGATRCKYCALFHTESAKLYGATDAEIAEASLMGGVTMCSSTFLNGQQIDFEKFEKETRDIVTYVRKHAPAKPTTERVAHA